MKQITSQNVIFKNKRYQRDKIFRNDERGSEPRLETSLVHMQFLALANVFVFVDFGHTLVVK